MKQDKACSSYFIINFKKDTTKVNLIQKASSILLCKWRY